MNIQTPMSFFFFWKSYISFGKLLLKLCQVYKHIYEPNSGFSVTLFHRSTGQTSHQYHNLAYCHYLNLEIVFSYSRLFPLTYKF